MEINEYQKQAITTAIYGKGSAIIYPTLGINGEAGEIAEKVKKILRDKNGIFINSDRVALAKEIGDVMWYCSALARDIGYDLNTVAQMNLDKLKARQEQNKIGGSGDDREEE